MKNFFNIAVLVCILSLGFSAQAAFAKYSFGDDVDSIDFGNDGSVKLQDSVDSIKVDQVKTNANGEVELQGVEIKDSTGSVKANSVKAKVQTEAEVKDNPADKETGEAETWEISIDAKNFGSYVSTNAKLKNFSGVQNANDLKAYIANTMQADNKIESVEMEDDGVKVEYKMPGKLFALIPVKIGYKISVDSANNVNVELPWWHIFATKEAKAKEVNAAVKSELAVTVESDTATTPTTNITLDAAGKIKVQAGTFSAVITGISAEIN